jgi:hypothetical protein
MNCRASPPCCCPRVQTWRLVDAAGLPPLMFMWPRCVQARAGRATPAALWRGSHRCDYPEPGTLVGCLGLLSALSDICRAYVPFEEVLVLRLVAAGADVNAADAISDSPLPPCV